MSELMWPDIITASIIMLSVAISLFRGLVKEVISLISWVMAAWIAMLGSQSLATHITFTDIEAMRLFIAFVLIFVVFVFIGAIVNYFIGKFVRRTPFSIPDRLMGGVFGVVRGGVVVILLLLLGGLTPFPKEQWWKDSFSVSGFKGAAYWIHHQLPKDIAMHFDFSEVAEARETQKISNIAEDNT